MKNPILTFLILTLFFSCKQTTETVETSIIPKPVSVTPTGGTITLPSNPVISTTTDSLASVANYLKGELGTGQVVTGSDGHIQLKLTTAFDETFGAEGYQLEVNDRVVITANASAGLFYGVQTLLQLMPPEVYNGEPLKESLRLPRVKITDKPTYSYRGMHLDPCRHFFSVETTKRYLDYMAYHKLNKFHWHLTEDQGWRIEIRKYPKLTTIGSRRDGTIVLNHETSWEDQKYDTIPVAGFYTQEEIREVVAYAKERFIEVIPEIEMPGHAQAALAGYPNLSCTGGPFDVLKKWGVSKEVFCAGNDSTFVFLKDVIDEVAELFPSQYIHIGGDECPKDRWKECAKCQQRIAEEGLADEHELQSWFISEMEKHINSKGKILIGWSEIMEGGIAPNAMLQSWLGLEAGIEAAKQKHKVIMSPNQFLYFDGIYVKPDRAKMEPYGQRYCWTNSEKVYGFNPTPDTVPTEFHPYFIGAEATMWSEYIATPEHLEYMMMPRISALAEITWTPKDQKDYTDFQSRMDQQYLRYDQLGVNYRIPHPPVADTVRLKAGEALLLENPAKVTELRYTLDGSEPDMNSDKYEGGMDLQESATLKVRAFNQEGRGSSVSNAVILVE